MAEKKYGHFDDANREYVITDPKTPWPWINYLGNEDFFSLISNTAGGYSFYKDAKFRRITRYRYNGVPMDNGGRYFYIKDGDTVWNPGWKPCKTPLDSYECRHGMNYTRITGSKNGVEASVLFFVPLHTWAEVQKMTLKNQTEEVKTLKVFSFAEWCLWNAATDMENFQRNYTYIMVTTDMCVRKSHKWDNYGIDLLKSKDLTNWTSVTFDFRKGMQSFCDAATATSPYKDWSTINRVWAPQIF